MSIELDIIFKSKVFWEFFFPFGITWPGTGATLIPVRHKWILWLIQSWILTWILYTISLMNGNIMHVGMVNLIDWQIEFIEWFYRYWFCKGDL